MSKVSKALSIVAAGAFMSTAANAATFNFDFSSLYGAGGSYQTTVDGLTLTVTAGSFVDGYQYGTTRWVRDDEDNRVYGSVIGSNNSFDRNAYVNADGANGLGVYNNVRRGRTTDNTGDVDGRYWDDFLILTFDQNVQLDIARFGSFDSNDDYRMIYDMTGDAELGYGDFVTRSGDDNPQTSFPWVHDNVFGFLATGSNDDWRLAELQVSIVPLPAGGLLLLTGLAGLAAMRRRSKS